MLIRKNTKEFKTLQQLVTACHDRADREKLIRLYITKAGHSIHDRISVEGIQGQAGLFYEMTYEAVLSNMKSSSHQLHISDEIPGIYFFYSSSNKVWPETPFEFDEAVKKEFPSFTELPLVRKKEKVQQFSIPASESKANMKSKTNTSSKKESPPVKEVKGQATKIVKTANKGPKQPDFKLKHDILFNSLDKVVFRQAHVSKQDVLGYYSKVAENILPYLKDRPVWTHLYSGKRQTPVEISVETLFKDDVGTMPEWVKTTKVFKEKEQKQLLVCNDREHLLLCVERGCLEFNPGHSKIKNVDSPDYFIIG